MAGEKESVYLKEVRDCAQVLSQPSFPLSVEQIQQLQANGNSASNWQRLRLANASGFDANAVQNCRFQGDILLGNFSSSVSVDGVDFASGCFNSTVVNCVILDDALVFNTNLLSDSFLQPNAVVFGCGNVFSKAKAATFANGIDLPVGVEIGGRNILCFAEMTFDMAVEIGSKRQDEKLLKEHSRKVTDYCRKVQFGYNVLCKYSKVINCSRMEQFFLGSYGLIADSHVTNSSILSNEHEKSSVLGGSYVKDSIIQWNSIIDTQSILENAFLCECTHVDRHGKVFDSLLGPNTSVSEGEVTSCFVGPFVGFHHQALLIATFWPTGKGNIGYGANVGSNHTLKAPDQELWPGEGVFFGLGVNIKFPSNFTKSPYSVVATGVSTLPQALEMPFSLINIPSHTIPGISPAFNDISPGWVLAHSVFTILRNENKFKKRNKSKRTYIPYKIFRPEIIEMMRVARERLVMANGKAKLSFRDQPIYTEKQVPGLGKNYLSEGNRKSGISGYSFFIRHYALERLFEEIKENKLSISEIQEMLKLDCPRKKLDWCVIIFEEYPKVHDRNVLELLKHLVVSYETIAIKAAIDKKRDDVRGKRIIPDYEYVHSEVENEFVIKEAKRIAAEASLVVSSYTSKI